MYLKRIEIAGFKSFADRTVIDFENSVTAVVGPNGSGKSNITEAIRWVLGEQSAKSLRGGKMPDIIFAGSDSRKALNIAEVTVVLDNTDRYLPVEYSEISVTRRLRRTGESDFFLNKQNCRLKDIQELFMDSGLGKESFSIISQGKVEAIFSSKPEDRRGIFEEAAGVLKYKQRKKKAEQKLFETEDNLNRLQDIIYELEDQLTPLAEQSQAAQEFLRLKEDLSNVDVSFVVTEIDLGKKEWQQAEDALKDLNQTLQEATENISQKEAKLQNLRQKRSDLDEQLEQANQQLLQITEALRQAEGQREVLLERSKHTQKSSQEYQQLLDEITERQETLASEKNSLVHDLSQKNRRVQEIEAEITACQLEQKKYQKSAKEIIEDLRGQYVEKMQEQASAKNDLMYLERQYQQEMAKNQHALQKQEELTQSISQRKQEMQTAESALADVQSELETQRKQYLHLQEKVKTNQQRFEEEQKKMYQLMSQVQQTRAKQKSLKEIQENYTGFYQGVRLVLQQKQQLSGIVGAVAELIDVPEQYTLAIETALGAAAQHIVVETEKDARNAITFLKENRGGRATFLPKTTIKSRQVPDYVLNQAQQVSGFLGAAYQLVNYSEDIRFIAENLLGSVLIAEDLNSANALAKALQYKYRVVSLAGDVMNAGGSMTGGATRKNTGNLFSQTNELQQLKEQVEQLDSRLQATEKQVRNFEAAVKTGQSALEEIRSLGETTRMSEQELKNQQQNASNELSRLQKEQQIFTFEHREIKEFLEEYEEKKTDLQQQQTLIAQTLQQINHEIEAMNAKEDSIEEKRLTVAQKLADLQAELAVNREKITYLQQQIAANMEAAKESEERKDSLTRQLEALSSNVSDHEVTEEMLEKQVEDFTDKKAAIGEMLTQTRTLRQTVQQQIARLDEQVSQLNIEQKQLLAQKTKLEVEKNRTDLLLDNRLQYLQEEYSLTFEKALQEYGTTVDMAEAKQEIQRLRRLIEKLGPVNLNAIEQYQQVNERHLFLTSQRDDLLSAKAQLFDTMSEMDEEVKTRFSEVFEAIRREFKVVFPNMFGGGHAELVLTDPTDLLNTGIEIEAQPPGKNLQNLSLLSGGERALTAIALLFSIIQVRPVPFCVLDEVEAALDEANVARFGHYLSEFQNDTQFIVVTHRKGTMEAADVLYGVTMQESGVSKTVSVRLEEISESGSFVADGV